MSNTRSQYKDKINALVADLNPMFDWLQANPILQVTGEESRSELKEAYTWLREVESSWLPEFGEIMDQPHTGTQFWVTAKMYGITTSSMVADVPAVIELRRFVKKFAKVAKDNKRPVLFGGVKPKKRGRPSGNVKVREEGSKGS